MRYEQITMHVMHLKLKTPNCCRNTHNSKFKISFVKLVPLIQLLPHSSGYKNHKHYQSTNKTKQQYHYPEVVGVVLQMKMGSCSLIRRLLSSKINYGDCVSVNIVVCKRLACKVKAFKLNGRNNHSTHISSETLIQDIISGFQNSQ